VLDVNRPIRSPHGNSRWTLQRLQNKVLRTVGNLPRRTPTRDFHMTFKIQYLQLTCYRTMQTAATVILNHENVDIRNIGQGEAQPRKCKGSSLVAVRHIIDQLSRLWLHSLRSV